MLLHHHNWLMTLHMLLVIVTIVRHLGVLPLQLLLACLQVLKRHMPRVIAAFDDQMTALGGGADHHDSLATLQDHVGAGHGLGLISSICEERCYRL